MVWTLCAAIASALMPVQAQRADDVLNSIAIERRPENYLLDGRLFEWTDVTPVALDTSGLVRGSQWSGISDLSARFWFAWDDEAFYFAADINDDDYIGCLQQQAPWESDSLMISMRLPQTTDGDSDTYYLVASERDGKPIGCGLLGARDRYKTLELPSMQLQVSKRENTGPRIEGRVNWADLLGAGTAPPEMIHLNFEARDIDAKGQMKSISWVPPGEGRGAQAFGVALLLRPSELNGLIRRGTGVSHTIFVQLVNLPVVVTDAANNYVLDLEAEDFEVLEDDKLQMVEGFRFETRPMTVGLLIDSSGSMERSIDHAKDAAISFLDALREEDRSFIISFSHNIELIKDLGGKNEEAIEAIEKIEAQGGTFLYAAMNFALGKLRYLNEKKVLVLLSDGKDESLGATMFGDQIGFNYMLEEAKKQEVVVYAVAFRMTDNKAIGELNALVGETGGRIFRPMSVDGLVGAYNEIASDLKSQYLLSYVSTNSDMDGRWRSIRVRVRGKNYTVRTRPGYYAPHK